MYVYFEVYGYLFPRSKFAVKSSVKFYENLCIVKRILQNVLGNYNPFYGGKCFLSDTNL